MTMVSGRVLAVYSALLTAAVVISIGSNIARSDSGNAAFEEIDVQRINVVEADGTLRMTISNKERLPGIIWHGKEYEHINRAAAGILFFNEESTETGGLIFGGYTDKDGVTHSVGHLSFDQYDQDQVFRIFHYQTGKRTRSGMEVSDRPHKPMDVEMIARLNAAGSEDERRKILSQIEASGSFDNDPRVFVGKSDDRASMVELRDAQGRPRIVMQVEADGSASINFLDANGEVVKSVTPGDN